jgi:hypothetical protein
MGGLLAAHFRCAFMSPRPRQNQKTGERAIIYDESAEWEAADINRYRAQRSYYLSLATRLNSGAVSDFINSPGTGVAVLVWRLQGTHLDLNC